MAFTNSASDVIVNKMMSDSGIGPVLSPQFLRFNNQTVADKIPSEMLHLVDPYW